MSAQTAKQRVSKFIYDKINELDANQKPSQHQREQINSDQMLRFKAAAKRATYSKILQTFLNDDSQTAVSHFKQAKLYFANGKLEQAISQAQVAKKKLQTKHKRTSGTIQEQVLGEDIELLLIEVYLKNKKSEDALTLMEQVQHDKLSAKNLQNYYKVQGQIYQALKDEQKSQLSYSSLHKCLIKNYGHGSTEQGLCLIQMGKNHGFFEDYPLAIQLINNGMDTLIANRYNSPLYICKVYETLSTFNLKIGDFEKQYSALVCAYSMIKQVEQAGQSSKISKQTIQILSRLACNLQKRDEKVKSLEHLYKIEAIERRVGGQSSVNLAKTVRKIVTLLNQTGKANQARKYEVEYEHLIGSRVITGGKAKESIECSGIRPNNKQYRNQPINSYSRVTNS